MNEADKIRRFITSIVDSRIPMVCYWCTVKSVSGDGQFCDVILDDEQDLVISDILIGYDKSGTRMKPAVDKLVLVLFVSKTTGVVVSAEETVEMTLMGDKFSGIPKVEKLVSEINEVKQDLNGLKQALSLIIAPPVNEPGNGSPSALQAVMSSQLTDYCAQQLATVTKNDLENPKVKHGDGQ